MYAKYQWLATATDANIRSDIVALMCGETVIANLSLGADKALSSIVINTVAAGWTVWDAAASATSQVIRALNADGTTFKYLQITYAANTLTTTGWELWNASTKVGTNQTSTNAAVLSLAFTLTASTTNAVYLLVTPRRACITQSPFWGDSSALHMIEMSRDTLALGSAYPVHGIFTTSSSLGAIFSFVPTGTAGAALGVSRIKNPVAVGDLTGTSIVQQFFNTLRLPTISNSSGVFASSTFGFDGVAYFTSLPIVIAGGTAQNSAFVLGKILGGALLFPPALPTFVHLDEIVIGGVTHILLKASSYTLAFPKE